MSRLPYVLPSVPYRYVVYTVLGKTQSRMASFVTIEAALAYMQESAVKPLLMVDLKSVTGGRGES